MIKEHERAVLTRDLPKQKLRAGDVGTVVHVYEGGEAYEVEFFRLTGDTLAVATVPADALRPASRGEILHARAV